MTDRTPRKRLIPPNIDLVGIAFTLKPERDLTLHPQYTTQLHGWFLHHIRQIDPELSQQLHDGQGEKAFTISQLQGQIVIQGKEQLLSCHNTYQWQITALSKSLCDVLRQWLDRPPTRLELSSGNYQILNLQACNPATTYAEIWHQSAFDTTSLELTFTSATSFRKRGNHMPLPIPENLFHSYLRRWNHFATEKFEQDPFLEWVNECVVILRHDIRSIKVQAGKSGSVTGFIGAIQLGFSPKAKQQPVYIQLVRALTTCAPYFNTGHKVTFGLGHTQLGWIEADRPLALPPLPTDPQTILITAKAELITTRAQELEPLFLDLKKRQGGQRANKTAQIWAQIIARQEIGDSLRSIATDLEMPYDTVKKYAQIAKKNLLQDRAS
jgi:CRISPR-associated endoribonuclease Cas6